jgi:hypothetical protein
VTLPAGVIGTNGEGLHFLKGARGRREAALRSYCCV